MMDSKRQARYTHGHHKSVLRAHRRRTAADSADYLLSDLRAGMSLLDIGCGPGTITVDLAALVHPGRVTALETSEEILNLARAEADSRGRDNIAFATGDVHALDFPDDSFDVVHAHQVLQHVTDPVGALRELRRVCVPGGIVAVRDADYGRFRWSPPSATLERWRDLYRRAARANGGEPDAGRYLAGWARKAGFTDATVTTSSWCYTTPADRDEWGAMWADRIQHSALARQLVDSTLADTAELAAIAAAWRDWAASPDAWLTIPHTELRCRA